MANITDKTVKSKYPPKDTNVTWIDTSSKPYVSRSYINGSWEVVGGGVTNYEDINNKPTINGVELDGNKTSSDLGVYSKPSSGIPQSDLSSDVQSQLNKHFKGWLTSKSQLPANPQVGDYAYVEEDGTTYIYRCSTNSEWPSTSTEEKDPVDVTFASSQEVNEVHIVNDLTTGGTEDVLSAQQGKVLKQEVNQLDQEMVINFQKLPIIVSKYSIQTTTWYGDDYRHIVIPVIGGDVISFTKTAGSGGQLYYAFLTDYITPVAGETPSFVTGYESRQSAAEPFTIPEDTKYLIVNNPNVGVTSLKVNGTEVLNGVFGAISDAGKIIGKNTEDINILNTNHSYVVCYTGESTATKAIENASLPYLNKTKSIRLLVKFLGGNTVDGVSLNTLIGTYPLYYKGSRASSTNSWNANDILDILFNPTDNIWYAQPWNLDSYVTDSELNTALSTVNNSLNNAIANEDTKFVTQKLLVRPGYCQITTWLMRNSADVHIVIPVNPGDVVQWTGTSLTNYYILLTDYITPVAGATPSFVTGYEGRQYNGNSTKKVIIPETCKYIAITCDGMTISDFTSLSVNGFNLLDGWVQYVEQIGKSIPTNYVSDDDLTIEIVSDNIANKNNIGSGLIDDQGKVSFNPITPSDTWRLIMIPLSPVDEGKKITFGGFYLGRSGYCAFYNGNTLVGSRISYSDPNGTQSPCTVTVPSGCDRLYIDIMSGNSPYELDANYTYLMVNFGASLLTYDEFEQKITKINGIELAGESVELEQKVEDLETDVDNLDNRVTELEANIVEYVMADLPVSDGTGIQSGYAYIDSTDRTIKVKE